MESQCTIWEPPTFDTSVQPSLAHEANLLSDPNFQENFARSAKWCVQLKYHLFEAFFSLMPRIHAFTGSPIIGTETKVPRWFSRSRTLRESQSAIYRHVGFYFHFVCSGPKI